MPQRKSWFRTWINGFDLGHDQWTLCRHTRKLPYASTSRLRCCTQCLREFMQDSPRCVMGFGSQFSSGGFLSTFCFPFVSSGITMERRGFCSPAARFEEEIATAAEISAGVLPCAFFGLKAHFVSPLAWHSPFFSRRCRPRRKRLQRRMVSRQIPSPRFAAALLRRPWTRGP